MQHECVSISNIDGEPQFLDNRSTWPMKWDDVRKVLLTAKADDVMDSKGNEKVQVLTEEDCETIQAAVTAAGLDLTSVTWPGIQKIVKAALEPNMQYAIYKFDSLNPTNALIMRKSGFVKKMRDMGVEGRL